MSEHRWIRITALDNLPLREGRVVTIGSREIALFNLGDRVLATASRCPHRGGPLADGIVCDRAVTCPLHDRRFDLETGAALTTGEGVAAHAVEVVGERVYVTLAAHAQRAA